MIFLDELTDILTIEDDLYLALTEEPKQIKKQSSYYDYRPTKATLLSETDNSAEENLVVP